MISFWWIRHAPVKGNNECCYGNDEVDCDLSDVASFNRLVAKLPKGSNVFSSHLSRTIKTFEATVNAGYIYNSHSIDRRLTEQDLGSYSGMKYRDLYALTKKLGVYDNNWLMKPHFKAPEGESFKDLYIRVESFINEKLIEKNDENIVIFSHGGPIRAAISLAMGTGLETILPLEIDNSKLTKIDYINNNWKVIKVNC